MAKYNYETHDFYCLKCGKPTVPVVRKTAKKREKFHRKRLWCCNCKMEINCVEITSYEEKEIFMEAFNNGEFKDEAAESLCHVGDTWQR